MKTILATMIIVSALVLLSFPAKAVSMGQILGTITIKETNERLPFAEIVFENSFDKITVTATESGDYYAEHIPTGKYQMRIIYNHRVFIMNKVRVYDNYDTEVNFVVSNDTTLPAAVVLETPDPMINSVTSSNGRMAESTFNQPTRSLSDALSMQPGMEIVNGKIYIRGAEMHIYIDGAPVMAAPVIENGR